MKYIKATNTGTGFITYQDSADFHITGYLKDYWVIDDNEKFAAWVERINGTELTREEFQTIHDNAIETGKSEWDAMSGEERISIAEPVYVSFS